MLGGVVLNPGQAGVRNLGLTPSHVYALWVNINDSLIEVARVVSDDISRRETILSTPPKSFEGKMPSDVFDSVMRRRRMLERLGSSFPIAGHLAEIGSNNVEHELVTPSDVFVNSGQILDGLVVWLIQNTDTKQRISGSYTCRKIHDKTPNDVFGLVDPANRRLEIILSKLVT